MLLNHLQTFDRTCLRSTKTADRSAPLLINAVGTLRVRVRGLAHSALTL
jgi:hypothetical protein